MVIFSFTLIEGNGHLITLYSNIGAAEVPWITG